MKKKRSVKKQHNISRRRVSLIVKIILLLTLIGGFVYVMNLEHFFVKHMSISGNEVLTENELVEVVDEYIATKKFLVFPRKNTFFLDTKALEKHLFEMFPRIYRVDVSVVERGDVLQIEIEERKAHSLWCNNKDYEKSTDEECYYVDQDGFVYADSPYFSSKVFTKIFVPTGDIIKEKQIYKNQDFDAFFLFLSSLRERYDIDIQRVERDIHNDVRIYIWKFQNQIFSHDFPLIVYSADTDYDRVLSDIGITINHDSFKKSFQANPERLTSIDVRFNGRVFFTFNE